MKARLVREICFSIGNLLPKIPKSSTLLQLPAQNEQRIWKFHTLRQNAINTFLCFSIDIEVLLGYLYYLCWNLMPLHWVKVKLHCPTEGPHVYRYAIKTKNPASKWQCQYSILSTEHIGCKMHVWLWEEAFSSRVCLFFWSAVMRSYCSDKNILYLWLYISKQFLKYLQAV